MSYHIMSERERDQLRAKQDRLIALAERRHCTDDMQLSSWYPGSPTIGDLRQYIYPQWREVIDQVICNLQHELGGAA